MALPSASFDATKSLFGVKVIAVITPTIAPSTPFNVLAKVGDHIYKSATVERLVPGADNVLRPDRQVTKEATETFELVDIEEIDSVISQFGSFTAKNLMGACVLWIVDQNDPTGTSVSERSTSFACSYKVKEGTTKFGGGDFSTASIVLQNLSGAGIVFQANQTV